MIRRMAWQKMLFLLFLMVSLGLLLYRSDMVAQGVRDALLLCGTSVIPSLFPMFVAVTVAVQGGLGSLLSPAGSALLLGLVGGYPVGAKTVAELLRQGELTVPQAEKLLCCCNNCGGAFLLGVVGRGVFGSSRLGGALWCIHIAVAGLFALFLLPRTHRRVCPEPTHIDFVAAVRDGAAAMVNLSGFVVFFLAVLRLVSCLSGLDSPLFLGLFELTCGCAALPATRQGFAMAAALVSWGGVSVHAQTASVLSGTGVSLWPYLCCKGLQGLVAGITAFAVYPMIW